MNNNLPIKTENDQVTKDIFQHTKNDIVSFLNDQKDTNYHERENAKIYFENLESKIVSKVKKNDSSS